MGWGIAAGIYFPKKVAHNLQMVNDVRMPTGAQECSLTTRSSWTPLCGVRLIFPSSRNSVDRKGELATQTRPTTGNKGAH